MRALRLKLARERPDAAELAAALGVTQDDTSFDAELLTFINSALAEVNQVGVGPVEGLMIFSEAEEWEALIGNDARLNIVKPYVYLYCKMLFDPPEVGFVLTSMERILERHIWRLMVIADKPKVALADVTSPDLPLPEQELGSPL